MLKMIQYFTAYLHEPDCAASGRETFGLKARRHTHRSGVQLLCLSALLAGGCSAENSSVSPAPADNTDKTMQSAQQADSAQTSDFVVITHKWSAQTLTYQKALEQMEGAQPDLILSASMETPGSAGSLTLQVMEVQDGNWQTVHEMRESFDSKQSVNISMVKNPQNAAPVWLILSMIGEKGTTVQKTEDVDVACSSSDQTIPTKDISIQDTNLTFGVPVVLGGWSRHYIAINSTDPEQVMEDNQDEDGMVLLILKYEPSQTAE